MRSSKIFITIFFIICLLPGVLTIFVPSKPLANEVLSPEPEFGINFLSSFSDYFNDHFALRHEFATLWAEINAKFLHTSVEDKVILGNNNELYYAQDFDLSLTDDELDKVACRISEIQNEMESSGKTFIFTIAPDKSSIHGENLPDGTVKTSMGIAIKPFLEKYGINYVDLYDENIPYYITDSHWNSYGAAIACDKLIGTSYEKADFCIPGTHKGDLYEMLYPSGGYTEENYTCDLSYEVEGNDNGGNAITIETKGSGEGTLFCFRDSFGAALYPYLASEYESATFSRSTDYSLDKCGGADTVILEIVERNLDTFLKK